LLRDRQKTVAVYEDLSCGGLAGRLQRACSEYFAAGFIANSAPAISALLEKGHRPERVDQFFSDPAALTDELAWSVRRQAGSDLGLALHAVADAGSDLQNMGRGHTYVSLADGVRFARTTAATAGHGEYDRIRMTLAAVDLLRKALLDLDLEN